MAKRAAPSEVILVGNAVEKQHKLMAQKISRQPAPPKAQGLVEPPPPKPAPAKDAPPPPMPRPMAKAVFPTAPPAPASVPATKSTEPATTPKAKSRAMAETFIESFCDRLIQAANKKGGLLTVNDLQTMSEEFHAKTTALQAVFERSFEDYVHARERASLAQKRNFPFDRVLVHTFEHLFAREEELTETSVSRRILPGFFMAMGKMLGPEVSESFQERCRKIVARLRDGREDSFNWDEVYKRPDVKELLIEAEIAIAGYFEDVPKRIAWFRTIVNNHLPPPDPGAPPAAREWQLTDDGLRVFIRALLSDLKAELKSNEGRSRVTERHGIEACLKLSNIVNKV